MSQFVDLARSLLTLEINTVLKSGMSAEKMPLVGDALIDIAQDYFVFLCEQSNVFGERRTGVLATWAAPLSEGFDWGRAPFAPSAGAKDGTRYLADFLLHDLPGNDPARGTTVQVFDNLREVASWLRQMQAVVLDAAQEPDAGPEVIHAASQIDRDSPPILTRIQRNSDQVMDIMKRRGLTALSLQRGMDEDARRMADLKTADIVIVRKAWDMGTETVVMQSTIQIDGDVVTRVLKGRDTASNGVIIGVHRDAVDTSFRYWSFMVDALGRFAGKAVNALVGDTG
ncbi:hypothetical protein [Azospirillum canadense]|uniref:hypothetical protein n=1 Tax=Azospirillum canadense TaxID=403962 RepID=UPI002226A598|nr:hypothetical protein [Azospirillum canadense]MCW2238976.1 hypothetical protein [Azospirillum canadense]